MFWEPTQDGSAIYFAQARLIVIPTSSSVASIAVAVAIPIAVVVLILALGIGPGGLRSISEPCLADRLVEGFLQILGPHAAAEPVHLNGSLGSCFFVQLADHFYDAVEDFFLRGYEHDV